MRSIAILDTGPLYAATDRSEPAHLRCVDVLRRRDLELVIPVLVVAEAAHFVGKRLGPATESAFVRGLSGFAIEAPGAEDWPVIADLVERYADLRLGTTDAATIVLADRIGTDLIVTLDRRHFGTVQSPQGRRFRLLPEPKQVHEEPADYSPTPA
ncbi:MAG: PIN domain-containing protein [Chloroflexota bacterium]